MSGLYTLIFGKNPDSEYVLGLLNLQIRDVERFRDCGIDDGRIWIYARTGGGNRSDYPNKALIAHPLYLCDANDPFDSTYALYWFAIPANTVIKKGIQSPPDWKAYFDHMEKDPSFKQQEAEKFARDADKYLHIVRIKPK